MRRLILFVDDNLAPLMGVIVGSLVLGIFVTILRFPRSSDASWAGYFSSVGYVASGLGSIVLTGTAWPKLVAWAKAPPKIAPRIPGNAFLEAAKREVEAIAPEHPDA